MGSTSSDYSGYYIESIREDVSGDSEYPIGITIRQRLEAPPGQGIIAHVHVSDLGLKHIETPDMLRDIGRRVDVEVEEVNFDGNTILRVISLRFRD